MDAFLSRMEPRTLLIATTSLALLLAAALFSYVLLPEIKAYRQADRDRSLLRGAVESGQILGGELAGLGAEVDQLSRKLHGDMANLPDKQLEAFVIGRLQGISWRNQVELVSVKPGKGRAVEIFRENLFDVEVAGDYFDLFAWLQNLTEELGFVVVKQFVIRPLDVDTEAPRLSARLTIVSYRKA
jgi:hypothetical protein